MFYGISCSCSASQGRQFVGSKADPAYVLNITSGFLVNIFEDML